MAPVDDPGPGTNFYEGPDPGSEDFMFLVAGYAWRDGLTANAIVKRLNLPSKPKYLMQVKRALMRAHGQSVLQFTPRFCPELEGRLKDWVESERGRSRATFHVVDDTRALGQVSARAAALISTIIADSALKQPRSPVLDEIPLLKTGEKPLPDVVICNAGGRTVSNAVNALLRYVPVLDQSDEKAKTLKERLLFVAPNNAYLPMRFNQSASFLSVKMAEMFDARHLALPRDPGSFLADHRKIVLNSKLYICAAGARETGLIRVFLEDKGIPLPDKAVGDLGFNFLDKDGVKVEFEDERGRDALRMLNPTLDLITLGQIAANARVVLILDADIPRDKLAISIAALKGDYATDIVLGSRLATEILRAHGAPGGNAEG